jgi:hypothetical protein
MLPWARQMFFELHAIYRRYLNGNKMAKAAVYCATLCLPLLLYALAHLIFGVGMSSRALRILVGGMFMLGTFLGCLLMAIALFRSIRSDDSN